MNLSDLKTNRDDTPAYHKHIHELFSQLVTSDPKLNEHRTYVETRVYGMGERSFWWLWKLLLEELPESPSLLEIGVFKAATMSLWKMLRPDSNIFGVTPLDGRGTGWTEDDYAAHIRNIHNDFSLDQPILFVGGSEEDRMIDAASQHEYDVVYVDGDHSLEGAYSDLVNYTPFIKQGGYLVVDDAACRTHQPFGYFQGIQSVCDALAKWEETELGKEFEFLFNVVHLMIYKKV